MEEKTQLKGKKILYLITKSNFGGAQKYVFELACEADALGADVSVALGGDGILAQKIKSVGTIGLYQLESLKRDVNFLDELKSFFEIVKVIRETRPDILHVNSSKAGAIGALAGRICGVKNIIYTVHGWAFNEDRNPLSKMVIKEIYWLTILLAHSTIMVSEQTANQFHLIPFWFLLKNKVITIKNGVRGIDFLNREEVRNFFQEKFEISTNKFLIGTLAELHPIKGLDYLIRAAKSFFSDSQNENIVFLILGTGEKKVELEKQIADLNLKNKVILGGFLEDGSRYLKGFDMFVFTSLSEAMPLAVIEAGAASLPVIATNVGGIPEIIENEESGILIEPKNENQVATAIKNMIKDPEMAGQFGRALFKNVRQNFSVEKFYQETFSIYLK